MLLLVVMLFARLLHTDLMINVYLLLSHYLMIASVLLVFQLKAVIFHPSGFGFIFFFWFSYHLLAFDPLICSSSWLSPCGLHSFVFIHLSLRISLSQLFESALYVNIILAFIHIHSHSSHHIHSIHVLSLMVVTNGWIPGTMITNKTYFPHSLKL